MKTKNIYIAGILFFLKNIWLSPSVNFYYVIFATVLIILKGGQDLKSHDILVSMLLLALSSYGMGRVICDTTGKLIPFFRMLPIHHKILLRLFACSGLLYSILIQGLLTLILSMSLGLPFIGNPHITFSKSQDGEIVSIASGYITDLSGRMEIPYNKILEPSLFFGIVTTASGYPVFPYWIPVFFIFFVSLTFYFISYHHLYPLSNQMHRHMPTHHVLLIVTILLTAAAIFDSFLDSKKIWELRLQLDSNPWILPTIFTSLSITVILLTNKVYRSIFQCKEVSR
jgi:hypothetical protein